MKHLLNQKEYNDILILERYINNDITEKEFDYNFFRLNEKFTFSSITEKIKKIFNWLIKNIKRVGIKIISIAKKILDIAKNAVSPKIYKIIILVFVMLITQVSFANVGFVSGDEGDKTELVINTRKIDESKNLINAAIGFLSLKKEKNGDLSQALAVLISIRDNLSPLDLNDKTYENMSKKAKKMIEVSLKMLREDINKAIEEEDEQHANILLTYKSIGEKLSSTFNLGRYYKVVKVVDKKGNIIIQWSRTQNY
ncbi:MAG: hypothetical protein RQ856_05115 [Candidatus Izemoplasmatales bacterium]|nr:hypothetical protein [Candidatus Izemoplasmatales bacterium]